MMLQSVVMAGITLSQLVSLLTEDDVTVCGNGWYYFEPVGVSTDGGGCYSPGKWLILLKLVEVSTDLG